MLCLKFQELFPSCKVTINKEGNSNNYKVSIYYKGIVEVFYIYYNSISTLNPTKEEVLECILNSSYSYYTNKKLEGFTKNYVSKYKGELAYNKCRGCYTKLVKVFSKEINKVFYSLTSNKS